jgi:hypothetical protein
MWPSVKIGRLHTSEFQEAAMNILLWVLQILLGFYYLMGGSYMAFKAPKGWLKLLPQSGWMALGLLQALFALGLVVPGAIGMLPQLTPLSAIGLVLETLLVSVVLTKPNFQGMLWIVIPGLLCLFVAYGRYVLVPF